MISSPSTPSSTGQSILLIDADARYCQLLTAYLAGHGFEVISSGQGMEGVERARSGAFSTVILAAQLPDMSALDVVQHIRAISDVPILVVTASMDEDEDGKVEALESGAEGYISKSSSRILLAHIRAVLRWYRRVPGLVATEDPAERVIGDITIDLRARTARVGGKRIALTPIETDLLASLSKAPGAVLTCGELLSELGPDTPPMEPEEIRAHIATLKQKLADAMTRPPEIEAVPCDVAYVLEVEGFTRH